jgi:hypothetical protein
MKVAAGAVLANFEGLTATAPNASARENAQVESETSASNHEKPKLWPRRD